MLQSSASHDKHIVIIGNGIAGITAARHIRKRSNYRITVISAETEHFYSRPALMYVYMGQMTFEQTKPYEDWFWSKNRIEIRNDYVTIIETDKKQILLQSGNVLMYDSLIIATGSHSNKFGWPGQDLHGVQGFYSVQDLALLADNTQNVRHGVIVGGGLVGVEMAEMLHSRGIHATFLVRESQYMDHLLPQSEATLIGRHIAEHVDLRLATELKEILPDSNNKVRAVITSTGEEIPCEFVALTVGVRPNISMIKQTSIPTGRGVLVNEFLETTIPDVYAIGDCAEIVGEDGKGRVEQLWYTGRMHGETIAKTICGSRTKYDRGILFNSAKFFDIEYQTYGKVSNKEIPGEYSLLWTHPDGRRCIRIVYTDDGVIGFNLLGIRYRHRTCEQWIHERRSIFYVLEHLGEANFDPEFFEQCEQSIVEQYNTHNRGRELRLKKKRGVTISYP